MAMHPLIGATEEGLSLLTWNLDASEISPLT
jgi:hypothetical protein